MAQPEVSTTKLADASNNGQIGAQGAAITDLSIAYTTDDPGATNNSVIAVADGDLFPAAEGIAALEEVVAKVNAIIAVLESHGLVAD